MPAFRFHTIDKMQHRREIPRDTHFMPPLDAEFQHQMPLLFRYFEEDADMRGKASNFDKPYD